MKEEYLQKRLNWDLVLTPFMMSPSTWSNGYSFSSIQSGGSWCKVSCLSSSYLLSSPSLLMSSSVIIGGGSSLGVLSLIKLSVITPETLEQIPFPDFHVKDSSKETWIDSSTKDVIWL